MDMKLSGTRIKELRLKRSWSQEKLAEEAKLNARTVQRAEAEGTASLRTRLQLAEALQVSPGELDDIAPAGPSLSAGTSGMNIYYLTVLILVSAVYLAAQPAFFSLSRSNFSWINYDFGRPWHEVGAWWCMTVLLWGLLGAPILLYVKRKNARLVVPYAAGLGVALVLAILKAWQPALVADTLTTVVALGGFALLTSIWLSSVRIPALRHVVILALIAYVFLWFIHSIGYLGVQLYVSTTEFGRELPALPQLAGALLQLLAIHAVKLVQLIPATLVLALAFGRRGSTHAMPEPPVTPYTSPVM